MTEGTAITKKCGLTEVLIFFAAIVTGTACSICSKTMMDLHGIGIDGDVERFDKPLFQTLGMFVGMMFGLVMHFVVLYFKIPFPGYTHAAPERRSVGSGYPTEQDSLLAGKNNTVPPPPTTTSADLPTWMYFFLAIPSVFDLGATALCMMGLVYLDVSIYQLLRGSGIIFVALMKQHVLKDRLYTFQWLGVMWNVISVAMVGITAILASSSKENSTEQTLVGVLLVLTGAFVQALQFVFEEKVMTMDIPSPPLLLIGMEGLWGTILSLVIVYPLAYVIPGQDHGSYEDPFNTWHMIMNTPSIQYMFCIYFVAIFGYNLFAVLVTYLLNSIWHAILDNFRPITVWLTDLFIYYILTAKSGSFGEPWTQYSYLQLAGMGVLLYGTAVYNGPHAGSILLKGEWWSFGLNFSKDYQEIGELLKEDALDEEFAERTLSKKRNNSSFIGERSPFLSAPKR